MALNKSDILLQLRSHLAQMPNVNIAQTDDNNNLELASADLVNLILWIEKIFEITISDEDMKLSNFRTLEDTTRIVLRYGASINTGNDQR